MRAVAIENKSKHRLDWVNHRASLATLQGKCCTVAMEPSVARQWVDYQSFLYKRQSGVFFAVQQILFSELTAFTTEGSVEQHDNAILDLNPV